VIGKKITELRNKKGLTQLRAAKMLKMPRSTYSNYELDKREPDFETAQKLASFFGVSVDELLGSSKKETSIEEARFKEEKERMVDLIFNIQDPVKKAQALAYLEFLANSPTDGAKK
jgi:transcriptional regulator with XRE-family HTH domain